MHKNFHVYILASVSRTLYVGVTSDLEGRIWQHKTKALHGFTSRYGIDRLVYVEEQYGSENAFAREKQLKRLVASEKSGAHRAVESGLD